MLKLTFQWFEKFYNNKNTEFLRDEHGDLNENYLKQVISVL
jgi:hypothetical protein